MSTATQRNRLELMDYGSNLDTWGDKLNRNFRNIDAALDGSLAVDLTAGGHVLVASDFVEDEARRRVLRTTGGGKLTIPAVEKVYYVLAQDPFSATDGTTTVQVPAGFSVLLAQPLSVHSSAKNTSVAVFAYPAAIGASHLSGLVLVAGTVPAVIPPGGYVDVKATAAAQVGNVRFAAGASARLVGSASGIVVMSETAGVTRV
ncbi:hypothetical protein [Aureimonas sp. AU40]|uniref:hypothetical protein n=1 Tax=Aureimonas sp. AU40 TaxID=1637747 RepID=UPI000784CCE6|nr:hypothetical protein [Aureimonas sp. AU40]